MTIQLAGLDGGTVEHRRRRAAGVQGGLQGPVADAGRPGVRRDAQDLERDDRSPPRPHRALHRHRRRRAGRALRARSTGSLNSVRGGGHNIAGLAVCEGGLMIDLSLLRGVWVDAAARTCAGAGRLHAGRRRPRDAAARPGGRARLRLGHRDRGPHRRRRLRLPHAPHGWTCDNLVSMEVVTADGQGRARLRRREPRPVLGAARRRRQLRHRHVVRVPALSRRPRDPGRRDRLARRGRQRRCSTPIREFSAKAPRELTSVAVLRIAPPAPWLPKEVHGKPIVAIFVCHSGKVEDGEALLAPLAHAGPAGGRHRDAPALRADAEPARRHPAQGAALLLEVALPGGHRRPPDRRWPSSTRRASASPHSAILMFQIDGALNDLPADHSPAGNRDAAYVLNITGSWESADDDEANIAWARDCFEATRAVLDRRHLHQLPHRGRRPRPHRGCLRRGQPGAPRDAQAQVRPGQPLPPHQARGRLILTAHAFSLS